MLKVGITGIGFMGWIHYLAYQRLEGVKVVAICDTIQERLKGDWTKIKGNFGPQGTMVDLTGIATYDRFDDLCADENVDYIDICLPPCAHAEKTIAALKAGKNVFCEKPISLQPNDAVNMVATAKESGKTLMIGHVLPFFDAYDFILKAARDGRFGKLLGGNFMRVISDPFWLTNFYNMSTSGGPMLDLHIHDAHFIRLLFGMPKAVRSLGRSRNGVPEYFNTQFLFDDPNLVVTATSGCVMQQGRPFNAGYEVHFEKATIFTETFTGTPVTVLHADGSIEKPQFAPGDDVSPFVNELTEATRNIAAGTTSPILDGVLARDALVLCHKQIESINSGKEATL
ncbi:MAG: Gfo/Idh/MocA family oxidoreductase [Planctomycetia bacterium]|nr:Gfo/Idh/MocA family oxidoreductase [Planctomycetia bacterium]